MRKVVLVRRNNRHKNKGKKKGEEIKFYTVVCNWSKWFKLKLVFFCCFFFMSQIYRTCDPVMKSSARWVLSKFAAICRDWCWFSTTVGKEGWLTVKHSWFFFLFFWALFTVMNKLHLWSIHDLIISITEASVAAGFIWVKRFGDAGTFCRERW